MESAQAVSPHLVLGVDGGGTKTLARLANFHPATGLTVLRDGAAGSSNQVAVGPTVAFENLRLAIENACSAVGITTNDIAASVLALAGSGTEEAQTRILDFASQQLHLANPQVTHDGEAVLAAGTPECCGIALIVGTGAVAYGVNQSGKTRTVGGWGYWFGDEGSAFWLGQQALRAVARASDGRGPSTQLSELILQKLNIGEPRDLLTEIQKQGDARLGIANLASTICDAAQQQDQVAILLLDTAASHWVEHIECLASQLGMMEEAIPVAIAGGVLSGSQVAQDCFRTGLQATKLSISAVEMVDEPVLGCLHLAARSLSAN